MSKTKEELNELKQEYEDLSLKLVALTDEELKFVTGGATIDLVEKEKQDKSYA